MCEELKEPKYKLGLPWYTIVVEYSDGHEELAWNKSNAPGHLYQGPSKLLLQRIIDEKCIEVAPGIPGVLKVKLIDII